MARLTFAISAVLVIGLFVCAAAQTVSPPAQSANRGVVIGRVIDQGSGRPVARAIVTTALIQTPQSALDARSQSGPRSVVTDAQGRFAFSELPPGRFQFAVLHDGYQGGGYGQSRPGGPSLQLALADGQRVVDLVLPAWKNGSITGVVVDEAGEPVIGATVSVLSRILIAGRRRLIGVQTASTDDRGIYHAVLGPGTYVVAVPSTQRSRLISPADAEALKALPAMSVSTNRLPGGNTVRVIGDVLIEISPGAVPPPVGNANLAWVYETAFALSGRTPAEASAVTLGPGEDRSGVDVRLRLTTGSTISGVIRTPMGLSTALPLRLVSEGFEDIVNSGFEAATTSSSAAGSFSFVGVPPGRYTLESSQAVSAAALPRTELTGQILTLKVPITVDRDDIRDLAVPVTEGFRISGQLKFEGNKPAPKPESWIGLRLAINFADGSLLPIVTAAGLNSSFDTKGQIISRQIPAGRYVISVSGAPPGWFFKSAIVGGRDVSTSALDVNADVSGVSLVFTDASSELSGTVQQSGNGNQDATVILFPADPSMWIDYGVNPRRLRIARVAPSGAFSFSGLPEGDYSVAALRDQASADWPDPEFLVQLQPLATRVAIVDGDRKTVTLKVVR